MYPGDVLTWLWPPRRKQEQAPTPERSPAQLDYSARCSTLIARAQRGCGRPPADQDCYVAAHGAWLQARDALAGAPRLPRSQGAWRTFAESTAIVVVTNALGGLLASNFLAATVRVLGATGMGARHLLASLPGARPLLYEQALGHESQTRQLQAAQFAHDRLMQASFGAQKLLGSMPAGPAAPEAPATAEMARQAVNAWAAQLDEHRRRHAYVAAMMHALVAEAGLKSCGARVALAAAAPAAGRRAVLASIGAVGAALVVGSLAHPFTSIVGFFITAGCLLAAGVVLVFYTRDALRYLDGALTAEAHAPAEAACRYDTLRNAAAAQAERLAQLACALQQDALALQALQSEVRALEDVSGL